MYKYTPLLTIEPNTSIAAYSILNRPKSQALQEAEATGPSKFGI